MKINVSIVFVLLLLCGGHSVCMNEETKWCVLNSIDDNGENLLHKALRDSRTLGHRDVRYIKYIDTLLHAGVDPEQKSTTGATPFDMAVQCHIELDYNKYAPQKYDIFDPLQPFEKHGLLFFSADKFHANPFLFLKNKEADWEKIIAAEEKSVKRLMVENSLARLFTVANTNYNKQLSWSSCGITINAHGHFVKYVELQDLEPFFGKSLIADIRTHLLVRCAECFSLVEGNDSNALQEYINRYPFVLRYDKSIVWKILKEVIKSNNKNSFKMLLQNDIDVTPPDEGDCKDDMPILHQAVFYNNLNAITLLVPYGVSLLEKNKNGQTAMEYAVVINQKECWQWLNELLQMIFRARTFYNHTTLLSLLQHYTDIVTSQMAEEAYCPVVQKILQKMQAEQECCICLQPKDDLANIICDKIHPKNFVCWVCWTTTCKEKCPLCERGEKK
jgi:hypothetical protein